MNKFIGIGNTVYDLDGRDVAGKTVANGVLAVKRSYAPDKVDFINFTIWGPQAESAIRYCGKGSLVAIDGEVQTQKKNETIYTKVNVNKLTFLQTKPPQGTNEKVADHRKTKYDKTPQDYPQTEEDQSTEYKSPEIEEMKDLVDNLDLPF
jgi:single-strand DNA-binding protein